MKFLVLQSFPLHLLQILLPGPAFLIVLWYPTYAIGLCVLLISIHTSTACSFLNLANYIAQGSEPEACAAWGVQPPGPFKHTGIKVQAWAKQSKNKKTLCTEEFQAVWNKTE